MLWNSFINHFQLFLLFLGFETLTRFVRVHLPCAVQVLEFDGLEKVLNLLVFFRFPYEVSDCYFLLVVKKVFHELLNLIVFNIAGDRKDLVACTTRTVNHKLQLNMLQEIYLIEIEHVEQDWIIFMAVHLILSSIFVSENMVIPANSSSESISPLLSVSQMTKAD